MDNKIFSFLVVGVVTLIFGLQFILISKGKLKRQTANNKGKKGIFVWGIILMSYGILMILFFFFLFLDKLKRAEEIYNFCHTTLMRNRNIIKNNHGDSIIKAKEIIRIIGE